MGSLAACASLAADLRVTARPLIQGSVPRAGFTPIVVEIQNDGPDLVGNVHVQQDGFVMDYPVECPRRSTKVKTIYCSIDQGYISEGSVSLVSNRGVVRFKEISLRMNALPRSVLEIGGSAGEMAFAFNSVADKETQRGDAYLRPEEAPSRVMAYQPFKVVYLAEGAERVPDDAVKAVRHYVLQGGTLVVPGGTINPLLTDARWADLVPVDPGTSRLVTTRGGLTKLGGDDKPPAFALLNFQPKPGAKVISDGDMRLAAYARYGLGRVVFLGFDLLRGSLREWTGRASVFRRLMIDNGADSAVALFHGAGEGQSNNVRFNQRTGTEDDPPVVTGEDVVERGHETHLGVSQTVNNNLESTFTVALPQGDKLTLILAAYFICVIPINFLVLHLLKKREFGWVTAPVISLVFAALVLAQARGLYKEKTAATTQAIIVAQQGAPTAVAHGRSLLFFAAAGRYDLKLDQIDSVSFVAPSQDDYYNFRQRSEAKPEQLGPVDNGQIMVSAAQPTGLTLTDLRFNQIVEGDFATVTAQSGRYVVTAKRNLNDAYLLTKGDVIDVGHLSAGESKTVSSSSANRITGGKRREEFGLAVPAEHATGLDSYVESGGVVLTGELPDQHVGPKLGDGAKDRVSLILFARDPL